MDIAPNPPRSRKPRGQGPSRRAEILEAAKLLFLQYGVEHATMRRIAAAVGLSPTALYVYFPDKTAILTGIAEQMFGALLEVHVAASASPKSALERLQDGYRAYVALALDRADEYRLTFGATSRDACLEIEAASQSFRMLVDNVAELIAEGVFYPNDPMLVSEALWAAAHGVVMLLLNKADHLQSDPQDLIRAVLQASIRGFRAFN